jgi:hypothetical protein
MRPHWLSLYVLCVYGLTASAQDNRIIATIPLTRSVQHAFIDRPGDLYLQFTSGEIEKYDGNGKRLEKFSLSEPITLFDPRDGARAFVYCHEKQWYSYAYFGGVNKILLAEEFAIEPWLVCSSGDKNIWILDRADFSLKHFNSNRQMVDVEVTLPESLHTSSHDFITMREYQGFLFILHRSAGIYIFNALGKPLKHLEGKSISYFNFLGEEMYYAHQNELVFYDLFDTTSRSLKLEPSISFILMSDERTYKIYEERLEIISAKP